MIEQLKTVYAKPEKSGNGLTYALPFVMLGALALITWSAWDTRLPNLSTVFPALGTGLIGVVINPNTTERYPAFMTAAWRVLVILAIGVCGATGAAVIAHPHWQGPVPSLVAALSAVAGLFFIGNNVTHPKEAS